jgi:hypothetical protein
MIVMDVDAERMGRAEQRTGGGCYDLCLFFYAYRDGILRSARVTAARRNEE